MTDSNSKAEVESPGPKATVRPPRRLSIVWLIPLVTVLVAGWIAYKTISEEGPTVYITFDTAEGLEPGKTKIIYKGVQAGTVSAISISDDLSHAIVEAKMAKQAEKHLTKGTKFWVVRPEVSLNRISGLGTLVSGAYIAVEPGSGPPARHFEGVNKAPVADGEGRKFTLHASQLGSIHTSAPVYHLGVAVGEVLSYKFDKDDQGVAIHILIDKPYVDLVHKNSLFWNVSGINVSLGNIFDASMRIGSLESLLAGGIAFANPPRKAEAAPAETVFTLYDSRPAELESQAVEESLKLVLTADQLNGVKVDDQITYRQIPVGKVLETRLAKDAQGIEIEISIDPAHAALVRENSRFWNASGVKLSLGDLLNSSIQIGSLESLVAGGIAFLTPSEPGPPAKPGHRFALLSEEPKGLRPRPEQEAKAFKVMLTAETLGGVSEGDPVLYRDIQIGEVLRARLDPAASGVEIELGIAPSHAALIRTNSVFWNASGVKLNLGDLVNASVDVESLKSLLVGGIALANPVDPGLPAEDGARYQLYAKWPEQLFLAKQTDEALHIVLRSEVLGSVKVDDPILYREVQVGKVTDVGLSQDASYVAVQVAIEPRYAPLVRSKTVFWNASGIHAKFGLFSGADIDIESLNALLRGGIAFATPKDGGEPAPTGATYELYSEPKKEWESWAPHIRLLREAPKEQPAEKTGAKTPATVPAKPEAAASGTPTGGEGPAAEGPTPTPSGETAELPTGLPFSGGNVSAAVVSEALANLGFTNIGDIRKSGAIMRTEADWQGETVTLQIDMRTGRIEKID